ncbi:salivary glue protein Sgs-3-like [Parasteatoda tepidariorum]|uniref:salivary glue protein Sgs-3-like n=1 Tax=Parasteatoda tepidariorum TaxID=114398 RepID=UPI0039BC926C
MTPCLMVFFLFLILRCSYSKPYRPLYYTETYGAPRIRIVYLYDDDYDDDENSTAATTLKNRRKTTTIVGSTTTIAEPMTENPTTTVVPTVPESTTTERITKTTIAESTTTERITTTTIVASTTTTTDVPTVANVTAPESSTTAKSTKTTRSTTKAMSSTSKIASQVIDCSSGGKSCHECRKLSPHCHYNHGSSICFYSKFTHQNEIYECAERWFAMDPFMSFYVATFFVLLFSFGFGLYFGCLYYLNVFVVPAIPRREVDSLRNHVDLIRERRRT